MREKDYLPFTFTSDEADSLVLDLNRLRRSLSSFDQTKPYDLSLYIETLCEMLSIIGDLHSQSIYRSKKAYTDRKEKYHSLKITAPKGVNKEDHAEEGTYKSRLSESRAEAEKQQWENLYNSTTELIQAKKRTLNIIEDKYWGKHGKKV